MTLPTDAWKEDPQETGYQDLPSGSDPLASPIIMNEEPTLKHVKEASP